MDAGVILWQFWSLDLLLGLMGINAALQPWTLDFSHSKTELTHLVVDEVPGMVYLGADQQCRPASAAGIARKVTRQSEAVFSRVL